MQIASARRPHRVQFDRYRQAVSAHVASVDASPGGDGEFACTISARKVGPLQLVQIQSDAVMLRRSSRCIARDPRTHYIIALNQSGSGTIRHNDRAEVFIRPGSLVLLDKAMPYETVYHDHAIRLLICVPRLLLERRLNDAGRFMQTAVGTDSGVGRIAADYAESLFRQAPSLNDISQATTAAVCLDLLATALMLGSPSLAAAHELSDGGSMPVLLSRIRAYIRTNLATPDLDPNRIAGAHGISKRYLHALFAGQGVSVGAFIREERLDRARADLANLRLRDLSVTDIALRNGFNDVPHFSRRFKAKFGHTPNSVRRSRGELD
jgi:AraC-like DNA-binding protein